MQRRLEGYAMVSAAMLLVGSTVVASKLIADGLPPFTATALRFALALPVFLLLMAATGTRLPRLDARDTLLVVLQAGAGSLGYTALLIAGLHHASATDAGIIIGTLPIVAAAFSVVALRERPGFGLVAAVALAGIGMLALSGADDDKHAGSGLARLGQALIGGAVLCEVIFILLNKRLRQPVEPLALSTLMAGLGLVLALPAAALEQPLAAPMDVAALWAVAYYAAGPTVAGFLLWYAGSARISGTEASVFTALAPASAVVLAVVMLGEALTGGQAVGLACVLAGTLGLGVARTFFPMRSGPA